MSLFIPITKIDVAKRLVYGTLSEEVPDKAGEILDYQSAKPAFMEWSNQFHEASGGKSLGNVRAMHGPVAVGKLTDISFNDEEKRIEGVAKIVDEDEWEKVLEGVYTGFSIGGGYARRWPDSQNPELMRYTPTLNEVSLVDNPAVPTATFQVVKSDGTTECRKFNFHQEAPMNNPAADSADNYDNHISLLLEQLSWLETMMRQEQEEDILTHIYALQDFLSDEDDEAAEEAEPVPASDYEDNDDTSSHAYAGELARLARRATYLPDNALQKRVSEIASSMELLKKRIEQLEKMPAPTKGIIRVVSKTQEYPTTHETFDKLTPAERARELMKIALSHPVEM